MTNDKVINTVRAIITVLSSDNRMEHVFPTETLENLGFDSLDVWEIALKIEERFNIDIEHGVLEAWTTVQDVIDSVLNEISPASHATQMLDDAIAGREGTPGGDFAASVAKAYEGTPMLITSAGKPPIMTDDTVAAMKNMPVINRIERADVAVFSMPDHPANKLDMYQRIATKSAIYPGKGTPFGLMYAALGLAEAGEVQNKVKKAFRDDGVVHFADHLPGHPEANTLAECRVIFQPITPERRAQIIKELGGVLWYIAAVCDEIGATMSEVALQNLDELCGRGERDTLRGDGDNR